MNIKKELLKEHSKRQTLKIVNYIGDSPDRFKELIHIFLAGPYRVTQRAAWSLSCCVEKNPDLILPYLNVIFKMLDRNDTHDAVKRNIVRLLQFIEIPKKYYGYVVDKCFALMNVKEPIAVRVFSMQVLCNVAMKVPDLKKELKLVIEDQLPYASAGFIARAKKVLKELEK
jgi:hypothetical protein